MGLSDPSPERVSCPPICLDVTSTIEEGGGTGGQRRIQGSAVGFVSFIGEFSSEFKSFVPF